MRIFGASKARTNIKTDNFEARIDSGETYVNALDANKIILNPIFNQNNRYGQRPSLNFTRSMAWIKTGFWWMIIKENKSTRTQQTKLLQDLRTHLWAYTSMRIMVTKPKILFVASTSRDGKYTLHRHATTKYDALFSMGRYYCTVINFI